MDDMVLFHRNKKELHKIKDKINEFLKKEDLRIKENWQLFKVGSRPIDFLGYRFYRGYTTLRRANFLRIRRRLKKISKKGQLDVKDAAAVISYRGYLKHANTYKYQQKYVRNVVDVRKCKEVLRNESRKQCQTFGKI